MLDFVKNRWFLTRNGIPAFVRVTRWERGRVVGIKYSVITGTGGPNNEIFCEGKSSGKAVKVDQRWTEMGFSQADANLVEPCIPEEDEAKFVLNGKQIPASWTEPNAKVAKAKTKDQKVTRPSRAEISDTDCVDCLPPPPHRR